MAESFRTFTIHGEAEPNTSIKVMADGVVCKNGLVEGTELFSFENNVTCYGKVEIDIQVNSGSILLGETAVVYPALYTTNVLSNYNNGTLKFKQIFQSKYLLNNNILSKFEPNTITVKDHFKFDHVTFNGPNNFLVISETNTDYNLDFSDIKNFPIIDIKTIPFNIIPFYNYEGSFVDWKSIEGNKKSLDELLIHVYGKTV
jgi:hypothetical protein